MISAPDSSLPKAVSALTLALVFALLLTLLSQAREHREPRGRALAAAPACAPSLAQLQP